jgi:hypothetical protein
MILRINNDFPLRVVKGVQFSMQIYIFLEVGTDILDIYRFTVSLKNFDCVNFS